MAEIWPPSILLQCLWAISFEGWPIYRDIHFLPFLPSCKYPLELRPTVLILFMSKLDKRDKQVKPNISKYKKLLKILVFTKLASRFKENWNVASEIGQGSIQLFRGIFTIVLWTCQYSSVLTNSYILCALVQLCTWQLKWSKDECWTYWNIKPHKIFPVVHGY